MMNLNFGLETANAGLYLTGMTIESIAKFGSMWER